MFKFKKIIAMAVALALVSAFALGVSAEEVYSTPETAASVFTTPTGEESTIGAGSVIIIGDGSNEPVELSDGESAEFPITIVSRLRASNTATGNAGTITLTANGSTVSWKIVLTGIASVSTSFTGSLTSYDNTDHKDAGGYVVSGFTGSKLMGLVIGHNYTATLSGFSSLLALPTAVGTVSVSWTVK